MDEDIPIIDAHHHFWDLDANRYPWLEGPLDEDFFLGDYSALKRNFLPVDYRAQMGQHNVVATVHCEAEWDRDDQVGETVWLADLAARSEYPNAIVAHAWFHTDNAEEVLERQAAHPLVRGIRSKPSTASRATDAPVTGPGTLSDPAWRRGLSRLEKYDLSYDLRVPPWHLEEAVDVVRSIPNTIVIINHTGFPWLRDPEGMAIWRSAMVAMSAESNVVVKLSEFGLKDRAWTEEENRAIVFETIDLFGPERCMFASNAPVSSLRISFADLYESYKRWVEDFSKDEKLALFHDTAARVYRVTV
jgi:predicted TIM-barrel fold metal-dependent hydrolase